MFDAVRTQRPAVILIDSVFPFDENLTAVHRLRNSADLKDIPVIMISGFSQNSFRRLALSVGTNEYLVKPLNFDVLAKTIEKLAISETV